MATEEPARLRGRPLAVAAGLVAVEGAVLAGLGVLIALGPLVRTVSDVGATESEAVLAIVAGALLLWLARGIARARRWARAPVVLFQLLALPVGVGLVQGGVGEYGIPLLVVALAVLVLVFGPARRAFEPR